MMILLKEWKKKHAPALVLIANNKSVSDNLRDRFPFPYTLKDADTWIALNQKVDPPCNYAIEADDLLVGGCGIQLREDIYRRSAEVGYWIGAPFWGQGIATEALRLLIEKIEQQFPEIIRIYAEVFAQNVASMLVLSKNGFRLESIRRRSIVKNNLVQDDHVWVKLIG